MTRPHTEFVQCQALPWSREAQIPLLSDCDSRLLSVNERSPENDFTAMVNLPPAWRAQESVFGADLEIFVLEGMVGVNDVALTADCYALVPAGTEVDLHSNTGARALLFTLPGLETTTETQIRVIDCWNIEWDEVSYSSEVEFLGLRRKTLRDNEPAGRRSIVLAVQSHAIPPDRRGPKERHPCAEEMYLLGGDLISDRGTMREGAYFWRPKEIEHGPFASRTGCLALVRFHGRNFANHLSDATHEVNLYPEYRPILPAEMSRKLDWEWRSSFSD